jgi:hypothetical protein
MNRMSKRALPIMAFLLLAVLQKANSQQVVDPGYRPLTPLEIKIHSLCKDVAENGKTTDKLSANDFADLPLGIARKSGSATYVIAIDSAYSEERGWFFSAYASIQLPGTKQPLAFAAKNIAFNPGGLASSSQVKLLLASTIKIDINEKVSMVLPGNGGNYIEWDCNGFHAINLKGDFIFSDSVVEPDTTIAKGATAVTASFEISTKDVNDILIGVSITPFKIVGIEDLSFEVKNAVADFSDIANPKGFIFPQKYQQTLGADIQLWRGFFIQEADVRLTGFSSKDKKPTILAKNLLIDDLGFSGSIGATNLLSLTDGTAGGWPLSINEMSVTFLLNRITGGSLGGLLNVPFLGAESVPYTAQMEQVNDQLNYKFSLATTGNKEFTTPFNAKLIIGKGSVISIERRNGQLFPSTLLNGVLLVEAGPLKADDIKFEKLGLTSQAPYITSGVFSTATNKEPKAAGFPVRIDSIKMSVFQGQASLGFALALNLMNKEDKGFSATTYIQLLASVREVPLSTTGEGVSLKRQEWQFDKVKVNDISLDCNTTALSLKGRVSIFDKDPVYGDGFRGSIALKIGELLGKGVQVNAYFGSKQTYRYWHFDAYVPVGTIPLVPPILYINGFMGGASYHMTRKKAFEPDFTKIAAEDKPKGPTDSGDQFVYIPDDKTSMAFMAGVTLIAGSEKAFNGDAIFEITFSASGGIRYVSFNGSGFFMTDISERGRGKNATAPVYANMSMLYDSDNKVFHANLKTYMNVAGVIKGIGPNGLVGEAVIHIDPRDWYIYVGRSSQMMGIDLAGLATAQCYFMIGTQIEDMPPPPYEVQEIFGKIEPSSMRDGNMMAKGRGFAIGARFKVGFDSGSNLFPFYIAIAVGAGADVMIRDYGDATCKGSTDKIGINGWYASGQAYVFLKGKVGVRVGGSDFDIVSLGAAALLEAKLPNPSWMKGQLGGSYKILGGLISGKFNLSVTIGEKCEIVNQGDELGDIKVIESLKPDTDGKDVSVFTATQVSFNTNMETEFTMTNVDNQLNSYRVRLQEFSITKNGAAIPAVLEWNEGKDVAILRTSEILPPLSELKAIVKIYWEKKVNAGAWIPLKRGGQINYEIKETSFTTGTAPDFIPEENVSFSHPVKHQYNFLTNESSTGYVKLGMGQEYLFKQEANTTWDFFARFEGPSGIFQSPLTYDAPQAKASFNIPSDLTLRTVYKFSFVKKPRSNGAIDQNVQRKQTSEADAKNNEVNVASNSLEGTITQNVEKEIYSSAFRTSQFRTFEEKINSLNGAQDQFDVARGNIAVIGQRGNMPETFDEFDLKGGENKLMPLVQVIASEENTWLKNTISPLLYDSYSSFGSSIDIKWRKPEELGVKPLKGVSLLNDMGNYKLTDSNVTSLTAPTKSGSILIGYYLSFYSYWDYDELKSKAAKLYLSKLSSASSSVKNLIVNNYTDLLQGDYPVTVTYVLPGATKPSYTKTIQIKF